jgi:hypothetical protein
MTTANIPASSDLTYLRAGLIARLQLFRVKIRKHLVMEGIARWLGELVAVLLVSFLLDRALRLSLPTRIVFLVIGSAFLLVELFRFVISPIWVNLSLVGIAAAIDRAGSAPMQGTFAARVASVLELPELLAGTAAPSPAMVRTAVMRCHDIMNGVKLEDHLNRQRYRISFWIVISLILLPAVVSGMNHRSSALWFRRYFMASNEQWPQKTYLTISGAPGGHMIVAKAEPFVLRVSIQEGSVSPDTVTLRYREAKGSPITVAMTKFGPKDFRYDFPPLGSDTAVELTGNDDAQAFEIEPIDRPRITELRLVSQHPTEASLTPHDFAGQDADLSFLAKTRLALTFTSNVPVRQARLKSNLATPAQNDLKQIDDRTFELAWTQEAPVQLQIELVGSGADLLSLPTPVAVGLKVDMPPRIGLTYTAVRQRITPLARIPLVIQARDDYGVAKVDLLTKTEIIGLDAASPAPTTAPASRPSAQVVARTLIGPITPATDLEIQHPHLLDVAGLKLPAGSILSVGASATDACYLGPQTATSRMIVFRIVPPEELFREILLRQQGERARFRKQIEEAQKIRDALAAVTTPDAAAALARQHRQIQREVARVGNSLAESVTEMKYNVLGGPEAWDLMDKNVLGPLKKLNDEAMTQQKDALDALKGDEAAKVNEAITRQEQIVTRMQEILKQMSQWDSFVDVLNQLNEIIKLETNVKTSTDKMTKEQTKGIFD